MRGGLAVFPGESAVTLRIYVCAAEASGDALGSALVRRLRVLGPVKARGMTGPSMRAAGVETSIHGDQIGAVGIIEALPTALRAPQTLRTLERDVRAFSPDVLVTIDSPSLLLRLARRLPEVPRVHWVAPQVWAWRPSRAQRVLRDVDTLLSLFPFERAWFDGPGARVVCVGHPDAVKTRERRPKENTVLLSPGSRKATLRRHVPLFRAIASEVRDRKPEVSFEVALAPGVQEDAVRGLPGRRIRRLSDSRASAALTVAGTHTLKLAAHAIPMTVAHCVHPLTWALVAPWRRPAPSVALPNRLGSRDNVVTEFLQKFSSEEVAQDLCSLMEGRGAEQVEQMRSDLSALPGAGAVSLAAAEVLRAARTGGFRRRAHP